MTKGFNITRAVRLWVVGAAALFVASSSASFALAQQLSAADAKTQLTEFQVWNSQIQKQYPALMDIEASVNGACREKLPAGRDFVSYCSCARSLTMYLWMSGADPNMVDRLKAYIANPQSAKPADFLKYQGPELYTPFCDLAVGKN